MEEGTGGDERETWRGTWGDAGTCWGYKWRGMVEGGGVTGLREGGDGGYVCVCVGGGGWVRMVREVT